MPLIEVKIPESNGLDQHEEYFTLKDEKINFHDYKRIYQTPGLYEEVFHRQLKCQSPQVIKDLLYKNVGQGDTSQRALKILDFGAGNGLVAEALNTENPELIVGVDVIDEARQAALRDRPEVYENYFVVDLATAEERIMKKLKAYDFNAMVSVAALGFGHIPPESFINAFNLVEPGGWVAFNLRDKFLTERDESGFRQTMDWLADGYIEFKDEKTYVHRLSVSGEPIYYTARVGRKIADIKK